MSKVQFDMPHALVTLTTIEDLIEIEVWPKAGQSAYVVVSPQVARDIAACLTDMAADVAAVPVEQSPVEQSPVPENIVDLRSRRKPN